MRRLSPMGVLVCASLLALPAAQAATAITLTGYTDFTNGAWTLGFEFSPTVNIDVTQLGSFFPTGATDVHGVTLYNTIGDVLATATVAGTGTEGFDYTTITPLLLLAGTDYIIGATTLSDAYADTNATWTVNPDIAYIQHVEISCSGVTPCFPTNATTTFGDFGANFNFTPAVAGVPEPESVGLLLIGLAGIGAAGARKRLRNRPNKS